MIAGIIMLRAFKIKVKKAMAVNLMFRSFKVNADKRRLPGLNCVYLRKSVSYLFLSCRMPDLRNINLSLKFLLEYPILMA
ncbi:MAG: hypothetical protein SCABRO_02545 [Candidatus Scalindua brodae]|uniref:Uncharacterized protein n=1 Tax=Candidatus Scalindua brodae TaxID=237368 RepID=A0A0B0EF46_9BACT|nr:MAG: hypothetical protein SCABRO_02545 [Candidatus Scalindua brodae]